MKKNIWVIKLGGQLLLHKKWIETLMKAVKMLLEKGNLVIVVHGGGPQADDMQKKLGIPIKKINGRRMTNKKTLMVVKMVYKGTINTDLVAEAVKNQISAVGISGVDAKLVEVSKRPINQVVNQKTGETEMIDFGYVGDVTAINKDILDCLLSQKYVPIVACLGIDKNCQILNINADSLATAIACQIKASKLIFITDVKGIAEHKDSPKYFPNLTISEAKKMIKEKKITEGMIPKIENIEIALKHGIESVHVVGALQNKNQWFDALTKGIYGTVIWGKL